jgi:hypothetical protein
VCNSAKDNLREPLNSRKEELPYFLQLEFDRNGQTEIRIAYVEVIWYNF